MASLLTSDEFRGVIPPIVSTFDADENIDQDLFAREVRFMHESGIELAVVGGSTGEGDTLTGDEVASLVRIATQDGLLRAIAGVITTSTRDAISRGKLAGAAGASALMVAPPIYGPLSDEGLVVFLEDIHKGTDLPLIFYNHFGYGPNVLGKVAEARGVVGIKEGNIDSIVELVQRFRDTLSIAAGMDIAPLAGWVFGAKGVIGGVNAVVPGQFVAAFKAFEEGDVANARAILEALAPLSRLMVEPNGFPAQVKFAINLQGREVGDARKPRGPVTSLQESQIREALAHASTVGVEVVIR